MTDDQNHEGGSGHHTFQDRPLVMMTDQKRTFALIGLALVLFTHIMDFMVLMPLGPDLMKLFQISPQKFSLLVSIYSFAAGIFGFFGSIIFDRIDRKLSMMVSYIGFLVGTAACALSPSYEYLLMSRAISGAFGGVLSGIAFAIVGDLFAMKDRGTATGKLMASFSLAAVLGVPAGILLSNHFGWHAPFIAIVLAGIGVLALLQAALPKLDAHISKHRLPLFEGIVDNLTDPNARIALITTFLMMLSQFVVIPFISPYLVANTGYPQSDLPYVYLIGGSITAVSGPFVGRLCDRFGATRVFTRTGILFLIPVFMITHLGHQSIPYILLSTSLFFLLSNARMVPTMTLIGSSVSPKRRGSFMSLNSCVQQLGSAAASLMGGFVVTQNMETMEFQGFANTAILAAVFGVAAYALGRKIKMKA